jgi:hypothetical protein|tara:strand:+ start:1799 stop:1963 length:165 start_codon:yes stop_codon:yes gene_type:complete
VVNFCLLAVYLGNTFNDFVPFRVKKMLSYGAKEKQYSERSEDHHQQDPIASVSI